MSQAIRAVGPLAVLAASLLAGCAANTSPPLPQMQLDPQRVAVAGLSSGAYMATQVHIALNSRVHGAALFAGGPYGCAQGVLDQALGPCMLAEPMPDAAALVAAAQQRAAQGTIDPASAFEGDRVLIVHGVKDAVVSPKLADAAFAFYEAFGEGRVVPVLEKPANLAHTFPTLAAGGSCDVTETPWLGACGIDGARMAMAQLFGEVPGAAAEADGTLAAFDQRPLFPEGEVAGLADTGYAYVPAVCKGASCGALLVFHGCQQNAETVGEAFVRDAGFNRWADQHRVVVVYPQTRSSYVPLNPRACWDWWGYGGANYDTREGAQVAFVGRLLDQLAAPR